MKAKVWLSDYYLYIEIVNQRGELVSHEEYGNVVPFNMEYVENFITYLVGECEITYM